MQITEKTILGDEKKRKSEIAKIIWVYEVLYFNIVVEFLRNCFTKNQN